jgi:hypothetical protein
MVFRILTVLPECEGDMIAERTSSALAHRKPKPEAYSPFLSALGLMMAV